jgi:hypothetical protein
MVNETLPAAATDAVSLAEVAARAQVRDFAAKRQPD